MASGFSDLTLSSSDQITVKLPKGFGASDAVGTVVELSTNNRLGDASIYLEMYNKKNSATVVTKKTAKNFLKYIKKDLYDNSIFHRSVPGFVLQGGGFSAPLRPADEGGRVELIPTFKTVKNQPGNSNLRGTVAMAKLAGDPDSATSQWFFNLEDNLALDTQNEGFSVFGKVLGEGMDVVDQLASTSTYNFNGAFSQLPLWKLNEEPDGSTVLAPDDFLIIATAEKLKAKQQPFVLNAESSDASLVEVRVSKKNQIKLKAKAAGSGIVQVSVEARSLVDGTVDVDSFDVLVGGSSKSGASARVSNRRSKVVDVFVDAGSMDDPFYRFFDSAGDEFDNFKINVKKKYRFHRLDDAESHPFFVSDMGYNQASSRSLKVKGDGAFADGITGSEVLKVSVRKSDRKDFKQNGELFYFCTSHSSMIDSFALKGRKPVQTPETIQALEMVPAMSNPVLDGSGASYRMAIDPVDQLPLI